VLDSLSASSFSRSSLVYLVIWKPPLHTLYISSPNQCLLFATHDYKNGCVCVCPGELAPKRQNHEGKTNLDLQEQESVSGSGISWAIYFTLTQTHNQHPTCTQLLYNFQLIQGGNKTNWHANLCLSSILTVTFWPQEKCMRRACHESYLYKLCSVNSMSHFPFRAQTNKDTHRHPYKLSPLDNHVTLSSDLLTSGSSHA